MRNMDDQAIIRGCKKGRRRAQKALVDKYAGLFFSISRRYIFDDHHAENVCQEAFVKIFQKMDHFDATKGNLKSWGSRIVANVAIDYLRKEGRQLSVKHVFKDNRATVLSHDFEEKEYLIHLLRGLNDRERIVFNMVEMEGFSPKEVAERLGINDNTCRSLLLRARKKLANIIFKKGKIRENG